MYNKEVLDFINKNINKIFYNIKPGKDFGKQCRITGFHDDIITVKYDDYVVHYDFYSMDKYIKKYSPIQVGDAVKIKDTGHLYSNYATWFKENNIGYDLAVRYCYGYSLSDNEVKGTTFTVRKIAKHTGYNDKIIALIEQKTFNDCGDVFLIGIEGLEKIEC